MKYKREPLIGILLAVFFLVFLLFCVKYQRDHSSLRPLDVSGILYPDIRIFCGVDDCERIEGDFVEISAWALREGESIETNNAHILLQDMDTGAFYQTATAAVERMDVAEQFGKNQDVRRCGLYAVVRYALLPDHFRVFIRYQNNQNDALADTTRIFAKEAL